MLVATSFICINAFALDSNLSSVANLSNGDDPIICEHTGNGLSYEVGPGLAHTSIGSVPWENLKAGDTVRIHWRETPYREKILIRGQGTASQPIVVCGVAGPQGQLPILDGENATTRPTMGYRVVAGEVRGLIHVSWGLGDAWGYKPEHVVIQGLHIRNAFHEFTFTNSSGQSATYFPNASGIFIERGENITVRGVHITGNGNGFFVASGDSEETISRNITLERSVLSGNGTVTVSNDRHHNIYTEAIGMLIQFNHLGPLRPGSLGSILKDRSAGTVIRYNRIEGGARSIDLVEAQDSWPVVQTLPEYRRTLVYGNLIINDPGGPTYMIHYGGDSGLMNTYRKGTLYFYHNTVVVRANVGERWRTILFDVSTNDETVDARNNIVFLRSATVGQSPTNLSWMRTAGVLNLGTNWATPNLWSFRDGVTPTGTVNGLANVITNPGNDPGFVAEATNNFGITETSPAINAGMVLHAIPQGLGHIVDAMYVHPASGKSRPVKDTPDLGAFAISGGSGDDDDDDDNGGGDDDDDRPPLQFAGVGPRGYDNGQSYACTGVTSAVPAILCVNATAGGSGNGTAMSPFNTINAAIAAAKAGDVIQVAAGTYVENVVLGSYNTQSTKHLTFLGGFNADFSERNANEHKSVIDGNNLNPAVQLHVSSDATTILDGFQITGGRGLGSTWEDGYGHGAGVFAQIYGNGEIVISHNEIYGNRSANFASTESRGGGIHTYAQSWGGANGTIRIEDNIIRDNIAGKGAGINVTGRQASILRNLVESNVSHHDHGGGIYVSTITSMVRRNMIRSNRVGETQGYGWGGGIIIAGEITSQMEGNVITDNYTPTTGSGVFWDEGATGTMHNDLIFKNQCPTGNRSGAGIYIDGGAAPSSVHIENVTIADHQCSGMGAIIIEDGSTATFRNVILWGNTEDIATLNGTYQISYSITKESGVGNVNANPMFVDAASNDYRLSAGSPAINAGDTATEPPVFPGDSNTSFDLAGNPRVHGIRIDMGAYENQGQTTSIDSGLPELPATFVLEQNYPNPFNPSTVISFRLPVSSDVHLGVYDLLGRLVAVLADGSFVAGDHTVRFDAGRLASGMYLYRMQAGTTSISKKMMLVK
jgi:hypothetical protein